MMWLRYSTPRFSSSDTAGTHAQGELAWGGYLNITSTITNTGA